MRRGKSKVLRKAELLLLLIAAAYAVVLSTRRGAAFADRHTWATVVAGCGLVIGFLAGEDRQAATKALRLFALAGTPMIVRSLVRRGL